MTQDHHPQLSSLSPPDEAETSMPRANEAFRAGYSTSVNTFIMIMWYRVQPPKRVYFSPLLPRCDISINLGTKFLREFKLKERHNQAAKQSCLHKREALTGKHLADIGPITPYKFFFTKECLCWCVIAVWEGPQIPRQMIGGSSKLN